MTDAVDIITRSDHHDAVIAEALTIIDGALGQMMSRELVSSGEVADLLLDVRTLLTTSSSSDSAPV
ncbi:MAG: hypothetical protein ACK5OX_11300 [Desertimonas sp.]